jgi:hypothetical protein
LDILTALLTIDKLRATVFLEAEQGLTVLCYLMKRV